MTVLSPADEVIAAVLEDTSLEMADLEGAYRNGLRYQLSRLAELFQIETTTVSFVFDASHTPALFGLDFYGEDRTSLAGFDRDTLDDPAASPQAALKVALFHVADRYVGAHGIQTTSRVEISNPQHDACPDPDCVETIRIRKGSQCPRCGHLFHD